MRGSAGSGRCHSKPFHCCHPLINNIDVTAQKVTKIMSGRLRNPRWGCLKCLLGPSDWVVVNSTVVRAMSTLLTLRETIAIFDICTPKYYYGYIARGNRAKWQKVQTLKVTKNIEIIIMKGVKPNDPIMECGARANHAIPPSCRYFLNGEPSLWPIIHRLSHAVQCHHHVV